MKATLKIPNASGKKLYVATRMNKIRLGARTPIGTDVSLIEVDYRDPSDLFEAGQSMGSVKGDEFDAMLAAEKAAAEKRAKKV